MNANPICAAIVAAVCKLYDTTPRRLVAPSRAQYLVDARWIAAQAMRDLGLLEEEIAEVLKRDRTTINHGLRMIMRHPKLYETARQVFNDALSSVEIRAVDALIERLER